MSNINKTMQVYKSRKTILALLTNLGYDTSDYDGFSVNEIDAMISTDQLDMFIREVDDKADRKPQGKVYVNYFLKGNLTSSSLAPVVEDLFDLSDTLKNEDCLVIIYDGEPSDTFLQTVDHLYKHEKKFVVVMNIKRLQFNILQHKLVPQISICTEEEKLEVYKKYHIQDDSQMPEISRYDPLALAVCMRPGQVCKLIRTSPTSITTEYYRLCS